MVFIAHESNHVALTQRLVHYLAVLGEFAVHSVLGAQWPTRRCDVLRRMLGVGNVVCWIIGVGCEYP